MASHTVEINHVEYMNEKIYNNRRNYEDIHIPKVYRSDTVPALEESIDDCFEGIKLIMENKFMDAVQLGEQWSDVSLYHSLLEMKYKGFIALLTLEQSKIDDAFDACERCLNLCNRYRRKTSIIGSIGKFWSKIDYDGHSEEEIHAKLCYAESSQMMALLTFFTDQSIVNLIKTTFRLHSCYTLFKECMDILNNRTEWKSEKTKNEFETGAKLGFGFFNLLCSHLPPMVLRTVQLIGFSGDRSLGVEYLNETAHNTTSIRSFTAQLLFCTYYCNGGQTLGLGKNDLRNAEIINNKGMELYPNSAANLMFKGRINALKGKIDDAITIFNSCIEQQSELKQLHNNCYWELTWCYALKCDWGSAAKCAAILRNQCEWAPVTFYYQEATFLYMKMIEEGDGKLWDHISNLFKLIPELKKNSSGKTTPVEKYACDSALKYFNQNEKHFLPAFDLFYAWNIFSLVEDNETLIKPMLSRVQLMLHALQEFENEIPKSDLQDNYYHLLLMKGICLKCIRNYTGAIECFEEITKNEKKITLSTFVPPEASLECGLTYMGLKQYDDAKYWLKRAEKDYGGYYLETNVQFRVHRAIQLIDNDDV